MDLTEVVSGSILFFISLFLILLGIILTSKVKRYFKLGLLIIAFGFVLLPQFNYRNPPLGAILPYVYDIGCSPNPSPIPFIEIKIYEYYPGPYLTVCPRFTLFNIPFFLINVGLWFGIFYFLAILKINKIFKAAILVGLILFINYFLSPILNQEILTIVER